MPKPVTGTTAGRARPLPADLPALLADAFRAEAMERVPRLRAAAAALADGAPEAAAAVVAEVHPVASSAVVVGKRDLAVTARWCELSLLAHEEGPVPPDVAAAVHERLEDVIAALEAEAVPS